MGDKSVCLKAEVLTFSVTNKNGNSSGYQYYIKKEFVENMPPLNGKYESASFWSLTEKDSSSAWVVDFDNGVDLWGMHSGTDYAVCVR